jgi:hypothetical protein
MKIRKFLNIPAIVMVMMFIFVSVSFATVNEGDHGLQLRGGFGGGKVLWGYLNQGGNSGDLGTGAGGALYLSAMYNYNIVGFEGNIMTGDINDLEWTDKNTSGVEIDYKSKGSGNYRIIDWKLGLKLFTEPSDMGYTFIYMGKRYWKTERTQDSIELNGIESSTGKKTKAKGDGWIYGFRDFSTIGADDGFAIVLQTGLFAGKAPVTSLTEDGNKVTYPKDQSLSFGGEIAAGIALQNIGFSIVGGLRADINITTFKDSAAAGEDESLFGFGNGMIFVEAGLMF